MTEENTEQTNKKFDYNKTYKLLLIIPAVLLLLSLIYLFVFYQKNNDIIRKDISLSGGTVVTLNTEKDIEEAKELIFQELEDFSIRKISNLRTGEQIALVIESPLGVEETKQAIESALDLKITENNSSIEFTGPSLGAAFYKQLLYGIIIAFSLMGIVVFFVFGDNLKLKIIISILTLLPIILFWFGAINLNVAMVFNIIILLFSSFIYIKTSLPSFAVILSAFADITMSLALVNILGIKLSAAGIIAFLMLIGYSVDTDIMLTSRAIKSRDKKLNKRILSAFKTGMTMTITSIVAVLVALFFTRTFSSVLSQIFTILIIGLSFDLLNTWLTNSGIIKWYCDKKGIE